MPVIGAFLGPLLRLGGAIARGFRAGLREFLAGLRPPPTPEIREEVEAVKTLLVPLPPPERFEVEEITDLIDNHYYIPRAWGDRPYGMVFDPERLLPGPKVWKEGLAGADIWARYYHPRLGEWVERNVTVEFDTPTTYEGLLARAVQLIRGTDVPELDPSEVEFRLQGVSARRPS
jgi:hypothetical protein